MVLGLIFGAIFVWVESRASEPIVPLGLFRLRTFTIAVIASFFAAFGFFAAVVFLPRWYQTVAGATATESGYNILPLLFGLIFSAISSGQIVARTGRYKWLLVGAMITLAVGLWMLTNLHANTDRPILWLWMLITGLGIGPAFAVFTLIVQNAVSMREVGVATASVGFFQQIGGTVGLTIAGTIFGSTLTDQIPRQLVAAGLPQQMVDAFAGSGGALDLTGVGDLGAAILAATPPQFQAVVAPLIPNIVAGIHEALSLAIGSTFWIGIAGALIAAVAVFLPARGADALDDAQRRRGGGGHLTVVGRSPRAARPSVRDGPETGDWHVARDDGRFLIAARATSRSPIRRGRSARCDDG